MTNQNQLNRIYGLGGSLGLTREKIDNRIAYLEKRVGKLSVLDEIEQEYRQQKDVLAHKWPKRKSVNRTKAKTRSNKNTKSKKTKQPAPKTNNESKKTNNQSKKNNKTHDQSKINTKTNNESKKNTKTKDQFKANSKTSDPISKGPWITVLKESVQGHIDNESQNARAFVNILVSKKETSNGKMVMGTTLSLFNGLERTYQLKSTGEERTFVICPLDYRSIKKLILLLQDSLLLHMEFAANQPLCQRSTWGKEHE